MRTLLIDEYLKELETLFGKPRQSIDTGVLKAHYEKQAYRKMLKLIKRSIDPRLRGAWRMFRPRYFHDEALRANIYQPFTGLFPVSFWNLKVLVYAQPEVREMVGYQSLTVTLSYMFATMMLKIRRGRFAEDQAAANVAAMFFGYAEVYEHYARSDLEYMSMVYDVMTDLSPREIEYVAKRLRIMKG